MRKLFVVCAILLFGQFVSVGAMAQGGEDFGTKDLPQAGEETNNQPYTYDDDSYGDDPDETGESPGSAGGCGSTPAGTPCPAGCISLNTHIPFIGHCIDKSVNPDMSQGTTAANVFVGLLGGMMRILMTMILIIGFLGILVGGFLWAMGGLSTQAKTKGKELIIKVIVGLILLGASGILLNLINPNFFGANS